MTDFGKCPVCNNGMNWADRGHKSIRTSAITSDGQHIYVHFSCCNWVNSLIREGQCDNCEHKNVELVGWNRYGKLCMNCAATMTILPLSEYQGG